MCCCGVCLLIAGDWNRGMQMGNWGLRCDVLALILILSWFWTLATGGLG